MDEECYEKLVLIAVAITLELVRGKTPEEVKELRFLVCQINATLGNICSVKRVH